MTRLRFSNLSLMTKLCLMAAIGVIGLLAATAVALKVLYDDKLDARAVKTQHLVESVVTLVGHYETAAREGRMSEDDARRAALAAVKALRYAGNEYFWINDAKPNVIMHPIRPDLDGKDVSEMKDPTGKRLFVEFAEVATKNGAGFVYYLWPKPGFAEPVRKVSYVKSAAWGWIVGSGVYLDDVAAEFRGEAAREGLIVAAVMLIMLAMAVLVARLTTRPLSQLTGAMATLASGDHSASVPGTARGDEIGAMARAVEVFKNGLIRAAELDRAQRAEEEGKTARAAKLTALTSEFAGQINEVVGSLSHAATDLQSNAERLSGAADQTQTRATAVAAASEQASTNVQTVASASEELSASIAEISRQVAESARVTAAAVADAERTNTQIQGLAEAAEKIGAVVKLINDIAGQTNLLALNATIEAARAGDAGKGFAVVASEVKSLANQTAKATEEISAKVAEIQGATSQSVAAIQGIGATVGRINEITTSIASAVEQQGAATQEIARNVQQASAGTTEVASNIAGVTQAASDSGRVSEGVLLASKELSTRSAGLRDQVEKFVSALRAA